MNKKKLTTIIILSIMLISILAVPTLAADSPTKKALEKSFEIVSDVGGAFFGVFFKNLTDTGQKGIDSKDALFRTLAFAIVLVGLYNILPEKTVKRPIAMILSLAAGIIAAVIPPKGWYFYVVSFNFWVALAPIIVILLFVSVKKTMKIIKEQRDPAHKALSFFALGLVWGVAFISTAAMQQFTAEAGTIISERSELILGIMILIMMSVTVVLLFLGLMYFGRGFHLGKTWAKGEGFGNFLKNAFWHLPKNAMPRWKEEHYDEDEPDDKGNNPRGKRGSLLREIDDLTDRVTELSAMGKRTDLRVVKRWAGMTHGVVNSSIAKVDKYKTDGKLSAPIADALIIACTDTDVPIDAVTTAAVPNRKAAISVAKSELNSLIRELKGVERHL